MKTATRRKPTSGWRFLSNHAYILLCILRDPQISAREASLQVGITERAVQRIVSDLVRDGYVTKRRIGRGNRYTVNRKLPLRHPFLTAHRTVEDLVKLAGASHRSRAVVGKVRVG